MPPTEYWPLKTYKSLQKLSPDSEKLLQKFVVDRNTSVYQKYYNAERFERNSAENGDEESIEGSELISYAKKLYFEEPKYSILQIPFTATRCKL